MTSTYHYECDSMYHSTTWTYHCSAGKIYWGRTSNPEDCLEEVVELKIPQLNIKWSHTQNYFGV